MSDQPLQQPEDLNDYRAWLKLGNTERAFDALLNHVAKMVAFEQIDHQRWTKFEADLHALRQAVESDARARRGQDTRIAELQHAMNQLLEWMRALDFDGRGVIVQDDAPPILRLLAALLDENRDLRAQNELIIEQNKQMIAGPPPDLAGAVREVRLGVRLVAAGLAATLLLLALHSWQMEARFQAALGWLVGGG